MAFDSTCWMLFRACSDNEWEDHENFVQQPDKYKLLKTDYVAISNKAPVIWQYHVDDGVDGKADGWYVCVQGLGPAGQVARLQPPVFTAKQPCQHLQHCRCPLSQRSALVDGCPLGNPGGCDLCRSLGPQV